MNLLRWREGWRCGILRDAELERLAADGALDGCVLQEDEGVGHAGDVVGDGAGEAFGLHLFEVAGGSSSGSSIQ